MNQAYSRWFFFMWLSWVLNLSAQDSPIPQKGQEVERDTSQAYHPANFPPPAPAGNGWVFLGDSVYVLASEYYSDNRLKKPDVPDSYPMPSLGEKETIPKNPLTASHYHKETFRYPEDKVCWVAYAVNFLGDSLLWEKEFGVTRADLERYYLDSVQLIILEGVCLVSVEKVAGGYHSFPLTETKEKKTWAVAAGFASKGGRIYPQGQNYVLNLPQENGLLGFEFLFTKRRQK